MSGQRLHELFGLPDPELDASDSLPKPALIDAAFRYRVAVGDIASDFYERQSKKERHALELAGWRWLAALQGNGFDEPHTRMADERPREADREKLREQGQRQLAETLTSLGIADVGPDDVVKYLTNLGKTNLLYEIGRGSMTTDQAVGHLGTPLRRLLELERDRDAKLKQVKRRGRSATKILEELASSGDATSASPLPRS